jgi:hypothetical protein
MGDVATAMRYHEKHKELAEASHDEERMHHAQVTV